MTAKKAPGPRTEGSLHLDGPPQGSIRAVAAAANIAKYQCAEGPPTESIMVAPGPLLAGVPRKHRKHSGGETTPHRMHNGSSRAASGGGAAETRKNTGLLSR